MDGAPDIRRAWRQDPADRNVLRNDRVLLVIIFFAALLFRLLYIHDISDQVFFDNLLIDQDSYDRWAQQIAGGDWPNRSPAETGWEKDPFIRRLFIRIFCHFST